MVEQPPLILVTRPEPQASDWVQQLCRHGLLACSLPLIDIAPPPDLTPVHATWHELASVQLVIFVSPNAAQAFIQHRPTGVSWPTGTWAATPGPGTRQAFQQHLAAAGLRASHVVCPAEGSPQFDSEHLWPLLAAHPWQGREVRIISGGSDGRAEGRTWLTHQLQAAGATVRSVLAYHRQAASWDDTQTLLSNEAYAMPQAYWWLLSSSQAIDFLLKRMGPPPRGAQALVTHPRVGSHAQQAGFSRCLETSPRLGDIITTLRQSVATAPRP